MSVCPLCRAQAEDVLWRGDRARVILVDEPGYPGYCRVIWNAHVTEMTALATDERAEIMRVVWHVEEQLRDHLRPLKVNLASLGNQVPHLHWHVIPRFQDDPHFPDPIWAEARRAPTARPFDLPAFRAAMTARLDSI